MRLKRTLALTLVFLMSMSSVAFGMSGSSIGQKTIPALEIQKPERTLPDRLLNPVEPQEKVRIIVELEKAPAIETATKKGLLYKEISTAERNTLEAAVESDQMSVQANVTKVAPTIEYLERFTTVFNGFSAEVDAEFVKEIADIKGVKAVYESTEYQRPEVKPEMIHSKELVLAQRVWNDYNFNGKGMVVGIIDTGIDPNHKDMVLSPGVNGSITQKLVEDHLANGSIEDGKYYTNKVPFGYNYMDRNYEILDIGPDASMHGMHVAGTVGANGDEDDGGVKGVAPEAQLLALKVFGNDPLYPSTFGDIYIKAIDDAIKLESDVINMSLGSTAGYVDANSPEQQAVKRATENGVLVAISAGNSDMYGSGFFYPYAENQDYGLTGSPSVTHESFGVASIENSKITAYSYTYNVGEEELGRAIYLLANDVDPLKGEKSTFEVVDVGLGNPSEFAGKDLTGKFALISRGAIAFTEKGLNAQAAGAAGVIIYNNAAGTINMVSDSTIRIPYMSSLQSDGLAMKKLLDEGKIVTVSFDGNFWGITNPSAGKMSSFTSWGPTPNLDFKPEITAPGGNIFSTLNDNNYGVMSGTSMAAPHVAGGSALIFERIMKDFPEVTQAKRVQFAKNLLMNTAKPVELKAGQYVSPRRQGAGLMQLANAVETDVVVTDSATGEAKVALKEIKNNQVSFTLEAKNFSDVEKTYDVKTQLQIDSPVDAGIYITIPNNPSYGQYVLTSEDAEIDAPSTVIIPANESAVITVTVDLTNIAEEVAKIYKYGFFLDGFVTLTDANEEVSGNVPLTVPFFGFNGNWDTAPIFDSFAWEDMTYWGYTALADEQGNFIMAEEEFDIDRIGFSPNDDGIRDQAIPVFSLFRNAKEFKVSVLDKDGKELRRIRTDEGLRKHYIKSATANPYTYNPNYGWDGKVDGEIVQDGEYFIELSGVIDFEGAKWQSIIFPVKVDTVGPTAKVAFDEEKKTISVLDFKDNEDGTGTEKWEVILNGKSLSELTASVDNFVIDNALNGKDLLIVRVWDSASNFTDYELNIQSEEEDGHPVIKIQSPGNNSVFASEKVTVKGTVEDDSKVALVTINGNKADVFDGVKFSHTLTFKDGYQTIKVSAVDKFGNEMQIARRVFVDTKAAVVTVKGNPPAKTKENKVQVTVNIKDNFDDIRLTVNGNEKYRHDLTSPYGLKDFNKDVEFELTLKDGKNKFTFEVEDLAGNKTTKVVEIEKTDEVVVNPGNGGGGYVPPVTNPQEPKPENPKPITPPVFTDITNTFAAKEINVLAAKGIVQGKTETGFAPNAQITRAEFAVLLARALDLPLKEYEGKFKDVASSKKWAFASVEAAARVGIINGTTDGKFNPDAPIKREEIAAMVIRAIEYQNKEKLADLVTPTNFGDHGSIGTFAIDSVYKASALGVIKGNDGKFMPKNNATRAEAAVMLYRALDVLQLLQ